VAQTVTIGEQKVSPESESLKFSATPTPQVQNPSDFDSTALIERVPITQQHAGADKGRWKGYILHPSAVKINCCLNHFVNKLLRKSLHQIWSDIFATVREYQWRFG